VHPRPNTRGEPRDQPAARACSPAPSAPGPRADSGQTIGTPSSPRQTMPISSSCRKRGTSPPASRSRAPSRAAGSGTLRSRDGARTSRGNELALFGHVGLKSRRAGTVIYAACGALRFIVRRKASFLRCGGHGHPPLCPSDLRSPEKQEELGLIERTNKFSAVRVPSMRCSVHPGSTPPTGRHATVPDRWIDITPRSTREILWPGSS
jgi:hypothetical protein